MCLSPVYTINCYQYLSRRQSVRLWIWEGSCPAETRLQQHPKTPWIRHLPTILISITLKIPSTIALILLPPRVLIKHFLRIMWYIWCTQPKFTSISSPRQRDCYKFMKTQMLSSPTFSRSHRHSAVYPVLWTPSFTISYILMGVGTKWGDDGWTMKLNKWNLPNHAELTIK